VIPAAAVLSANLTLQGIDASIGRDNPRDCILYDGSMGLFTLAFKILLATGDRALPSVAARLHSP